MLSKSLSSSLLFIWHPLMHLFLQSWPAVSHVCFKLSAEDYRKKSGRPSSMNEVLSAWRKQGCSNLFIQACKRAGTLLRKSIHRHTLSEQGLRDWWLITLASWMSIHDSARLGDTSVFVLVICWSTGGFLRWRSQSITAATWAQSSRAVLAAGLTGGLPRQRDWTGVMIAIRQLYEYLWQTSALKNIAWMLHGPAS